MARTTRRPRADYDGAWKEALDQQLEPLLRLCFPAVHAGIDWQKGVKSLDTELRNIVGNTKRRKRQVDKLIEVWRLDGTQEWLLIHLEVQSQPDPHLPERMYRYHYLIAERYGRRVVSLAILADNSPGYRPGPYQEETWGCRLRFEYPVCKLSDFTDETLEREDNPAAIVIAAHRAAQNLRRDPVGLKAAKWQVFRRLYERGYDKEAIRKLMVLIDWLIQLPDDLAIEFQREFTEYEAQKTMPYITSFERIGRKEGRQEGRLLAARDDLRLVLETRFGQVPPALAERIATLNDLDRLQQLLRRAAIAPSLAEFEEAL